MYMLVRMQSSGMDGTGFNILKTLTGQNLIRIRSKFMRYYQKSSPSPRAGEGKGEGEGEG